MRRPRWHGRRTPSTPSGRPSLREAVYFTGTEGKRGAVAIYNVDSAAKVPSFCEPWFLGLNASCEIQIAMTPEDLKAAGLDEIGKRWRG